MPTEKGDVFTLASSGDLDSFKNKFILEEINKKDEFGSLKSWIISAYIT